MSKHLFKLLPLLLLCALLLGACQLVEDQAAPADSSANGDRLRGLFVSHTELSVYISQHQELQADENDRIYATQTEDGDFSFPALPGIPLLCIYTIEAENSSSSEVFASSDYGDIRDCALSVNSSDSGTALELTGHLDVRCDALSDTLFNFYQLYQTADGLVYLKLSDCHGSSYSGFDKTGNIGSFSKSEEFTSSSGSGKVTQTDSTESFKVTLYINATEPTDHYQLLEMDADNHPLRSTALYAGQLPESFVPSAGCAYMVLETVDQQQQVCRRRIVETDGDDLTLSFAGDNSPFLRAYLLNIE